MYYKQLIVTKDCKNPTHFQIPYCKIKINLLCHCINKLSWKMVNLLHIFFRSMIYKYFDISFTVVSLSFIWMSFQVEFWFSLKWYHFFKLKIDQIIKFKLWMIRIENEFLIYSLWNDRLLSIITKSNKAILCYRDNTIDASVFVRII